MITNDPLSKSRPPPIRLNFYSEWVYNQNLDICRFPFSTLIISYNSRVKLCTVCCGEMWWFSSFSKNSFIFKLWNKSQHGTIWQYIHPPYPHRDPLIILHHRHHDRTNQYIEVVIWYIFLRHRRWFGERPSITLSTVNGLKSCGSMSLSVATAASIDVAITGNISWRTA